MMRAAGGVLLAVMLEGVAVHGLGWDREFFGPAECGECMYENDGSGTLTVFTPGCVADCKTLSLDSRDLTTIPEDVFQGQKMWVIRLAYNMIESLPPAVFEGCGDMLHLILSRNPLTTLPADLLSGRGLTSLEVLHATGMYLTEIPTGFLSGLSTLEEIKLGTNLLKTLPADLLSGLTALISFQVGVNRLTSIPSTLFADTTALEQITLSKNNLATLPDNLFAGLTNVRFLALGQNKFTAVKAAWFAGMSSLEELYLDENQITYLEPGIFNTLVNLKELHMSGMGIQSIPDGLLAPATTLEFLDLTDNALTELPTSFFSGPLAWGVILLDENPFTCKLDTSGLTGPATCNDCPYKETPSGYDGLDVCTEATDCVEVDMGTIQHQVVEIAGSRFATVENMEACHDLCKANSAEVWTFKHNIKSCKCKLMLPGFYHFPNPGRTTGFVGTYVSTPCA